jgi:hypothetical protein
MWAIGGTFGSICASFSTDITIPKYIFTLCAIFGLLTCFCGILMDSMRYRRQRDFAKLKPFYTNLKLKMKLIWRMTKHPVIWKLYAFILIAGLQPEFGEYEQHFLEKCLGVGE